MNTETLLNLKIHKIPEEEFESNLEAGSLDANALYLTPDDGVAKEAERLTIETVGDADTPVYFSAGKPVACKTVDASALINTLSEGTSDPQDADFYVSQYAGGGATATSYHRRPHSALWNYIKGKIKDILGLDKDSYSGTAAKANQLVNEQTVEVTGAVTGSVTFDGSAKTALTLDTAVNHNHDNLYYTKGAIDEAVSNLDAENVYFSDNIIVTTDVGNVKVDKNTGTGTIESKDKNLKQVFQYLWSSDKEPTVTQPSVSISSSNGGSYEVGTSLTPTFTATFNSGSYPYGSKEDKTSKSTGVIVSKWEANTSYNSESKTDTSKANTFSPTFNSLTIANDTTTYTITVNAEHSASDRDPLTALGNIAKPENKIVSSTKSKIVSYNGYRNTFWGTLTSKSTLTSAIIRDLAGKSGYSYGNGSNFTINIPKDCLRIIFAYPATLQDVTKVLDENDSNSNIVSSFSKSTLSVNGANSSNATSYKVYTMDLAKANDTVNKLHVTI
jgi:hypothetical protein